MFQRFASALFGDDMEELGRSSGPGGGREEAQQQEEDEDWILVNYLSESVGVGICLLRMEPHDVMASLDAAAL